METKPFLHAQTAAQYLTNWPGETRAVQCIATSPEGAVNIEYFEGNWDRRLIGAFIASHVFVNGWTVSAKEISIAL